MIWYIIIIIFFLFFILYQQSVYKESYENVSINIGNVLADYYYKYFISILKKEDFIYENKEQFINLFPKFLLFNEEIFNNLNENNIKYENYKNHESVAFWISNKKELQLIHNIMKPYINKIFNDTFIKNNLQKEVNYPVIHFRCADTPFSLHRQYYFQKYTFFKTALNNLSNFDKIIILSCNTHYSNDKNKISCNKYVDLLKQALIDYNPIIECGTNVDDFISMFYAPAVISTQSSYSFMSGFFGNGIYIQPNFMESNKECDECESMYKGYNIPHSIVNDYHNIDQVYSILNT